MQKVIFTFSMLFMFDVHASRDSLIEPNVTWLKNEIRVCWKSSNNDFDVEQKQDVQKIVEQEYKLDRVGITFVGWKECAQLSPSDYDLEIYQDQDPGKPDSLLRPFRNAGVEGYAVMGQGGTTQTLSVSNLQTGEETKTHGYFNRHLQKPMIYLMYRPLFRLFEDHFKSREELQLTALHEFGHVAGLRHEHILPEAKKDPNCVYLPSRVDSEKPEDTTVQKGNYDPNSVMNYCWTSTLAELGNVVNRLPNLKDETLYSVKVNPKTKQKTYFIKIGLSAGDVSTLKQAYVVSP